MIVVNGAKYRTLADKFYVNGARVYEAYANGVKVYPEDATVFYAVIDGTMAGTAQRTLNPDQKYVSEYNQPVTLSVPYTIDYSYAYQLPSTFDPETSKVELLDGIVYCDGEVVRNAVRATGRFGVGLVSPQEVFSILNQGGNQYTIVSRSWYHGLNVLSSANGMTSEASNGIVVGLDQCGVDHTLTGDMYPAEQTFSAQSLAYMNRNGPNERDGTGEVTVSAGFYEAFEVRTMEAFMGSVYVDYTIKFMNLYTGAMSPPGNETLRVIADLDDV